MTTYKQSGVNIEAGDRASALAYAQAARTFTSRKGLIGMPVKEEGGYGGLLDMGDHYLVITSDGTGSKMSLAIATGNFTTLGYDLLAMVADDMICTGAETIAVTNTFDVASVYPLAIETLMKGFADACVAQKIVIPAGEVAEVPSAVIEPVWNATAIGIVAKDRILNPSKISVGDVVIALKDPVARSNGFSLVRTVLKKAHGEHWEEQEWRDGKTWAQIFLTPSTVYSGALLTLLGRYGGKRAVDIKGLAHITGGGIPSKFGRILKKCGLGAMLTDLWAPHDALQDVIKLGDVETAEAYRTWHMGQGMLVVVSPKDADATLAGLTKEGIEARPAGLITKEPDIVLTAFTGETLKFPVSA